MSVFTLLHHYTSQKFDMALVFRIVLVPVHAGKIIEQRHSSFELEELLLLGSPSQ